MLQTFFCFFNLQAVAFMTDFADICRQIFSSKE